MFLYVVYLFRGSSSMGNLVELLKLKKGNKFWATAGRPTPTMGHLHALSLIAKSTICMHYSESFICWTNICHETRSCLQLRTTYTKACMVVGSWESHVFAIQNTKAAIPSPCHSPAALSERDLSRPFTTFILISLRGRSKLRRVNIYYRDD